MLLLIFYIILFLDNQISRSVSIIQWALRIPSKTAYIFNDKIRNIRCKCTLLKALDSYENIFILLHIYYITFIQLNNNKTISQVAKQKASPNGEPIPFTTRLGMAAVAGGCGGILGTPGDMINVRMQNDIKLPVEQRRK